MDGLHRDGVQEELIGEMIRDNDKEITSYLNEVGEGLMEEDPDRRDGSDDDEAGGSGDDEMDDEAHGSGSGTIICTTKSSEVYS